VDGFVHGGKHIGVLAHAEIVVRAPDRYFGRPVRPAMSLRPGEFTARPLTIGEDPVIAVLAKLVELLVEQGVVLHSMHPSPSQGERPTQRAWPWLALIPERSILQAP